MVLEQPVGILAEPAVGRPARGLHVGHVPGLRPEHPQERLGVHRAGAHFDVERLLNQAPLCRPVVGEFGDEVLKCHEWGPSSLTTRAERRVLSRCMAINRWCACSSSRSAAAGPTLSATSAGVRASNAAEERHRLGRQITVPRSHSAGRRTARSDSTSTSPAAQALAAARAPIDRRVDAFEPQQPVLEVAGQPIHGRPSTQRRRHGRPQPKQPLVGRVVGRPLVDELGEVRRVPEHPRRFPRFQPTHRARGVAWGSTRSSRTSSRCSRSM